MLGNVLAQHLQRLIVLTHRNEKLGLLLNVEQLFRVNDVVQDGPGGRTGSCRRL